MKKSYWVILIVVLIFLAFLVIANTANNTNNEGNILNLMNNKEEFVVENMTTSVNKNNNTNFYDVIIDGVVIPQKDSKDFYVNVTFYDKNGKKFEKHYEAFNETEAIAFHEYGFRLLTEEKSKPYKMIIDIYSGNNTTSQFTKEIIL